MFPFFRALFFSKLVLLTPQNIDVNNNSLLTLETPIFAITNNARFMIDVQSMVPKGTNYFDGSSDQFFPKGCVTIRLLNNENKSFDFSSYNRLGPSSDGSVNLMINFDGKVPTDTKFNRMEIHTTCPLKNVKIYWDNAGSI
jgi:hypothetical protein